jgi:hypothetical protein
MARRDCGPKVPALPVVGIGVATPALVWATEIGKRPTPQLFEGELEGPMFGPYAVDVRLE